MGAWFGVAESREIRRSIMKKIALAAAFAAAAATTASAGNIVEPMVEAPVVVEQATESSAGILLPLILLALVAVAVAGD